MKVKFVVSLLALVISQTFFQAYAWDSNQWHHYLRVSDNKLISASLDFRVAQTGTSGSNWTLIYPIEFWINVVTPAFGHDKTLEVQITYFSNYEPGKFSESIRLEHASNAAGTPNRHTGKFNTSNLQIQVALGEYQNVGRQWNKYQQKIDIYVVSEQSGQWEREELLDSFEVRLIDYLNN